MNNFFVYNNQTSSIEFNEPEILLVSEFAKLMELDRNKCPEDPKGTYRKRAFRELTYIYLAINWRSPYADYNEQDRHHAALRDAKMTEEEFNNPEFREACRTYRRLQESNRSIKMLNAAQNTVDKFIDYFNNIDPEERDPVSGKPIFKVKDIMGEISSLHKVEEELKILESQVKKEMQEVNSTRAGAVDGYLPNV